MNSESLKCSESFIRIKNLKRTRIYRITRIVKIFIRILVRISSEAILLIYTLISEVFERILVRIFIKDFCYDNPKRKSLLTYATVRCFWEAILGGSGVALDIQTKILKKILN